MQLCEIARGAGGFLALSSCNSGPETPTIHFWRCDPPQLAAATEAHMALDSGQGRGGPAAALAGRRTTGRGRRRGRRRPSRWGAAGAGRGPAPPKPGGLCPALGPGNPRQAAKTLLSGHITWAQRCFPVAPLPRATSLVAIMQGGTKPPIYAMQKKKKWGKKEKT